MLLLLTIVSICVGVVETIPFYFFFYQFFRGAEEIMEYWGMETLSHHLFLAF